jgi:hypothetical protein
LGPQGEGLQGFPTGAGVVARRQDIRQVQSTLIEKQVIKTDIEVLKYKKQHKNRSSKKVRQ